MTDAESILHRNLRRNGILEMRISRAFVVASTCRARSTVPSRLSPRSTVGARRDSSRGPGSCRGFCRLRRNLRRTYRSSTVGPQE